MQISRYFFFCLSTLFGISAVSYLLGRSKLERRFVLLEEMNSPYSETIPSLDWKPTQEDHSGVPGPGENYSTNDMDQVDYPKSLRQKLHEIIYQLLLAISGALGASIIFSRTWDMFGFLSLAVALLSVGAAFLGVFRRDKYPRAPLVAFEFLLGITWMSRANNWNCSGHVLLSIGAVAEALLLVASACL